jgi:hypothetical protein
MDVISSSRLACLALADDSQCIEALDIHRWGLFGRTRIVSSIFAKIQVGLALKEHGHYVNIDFIWDLSDSVGWRYFHGCQECCHDADDFGLAFQLFAKVNKPSMFNVDQRMRYITTAMLHPDSDGAVFTWINHPSDKSSRDRGNQRDYCVTVACNFYLGLVQLYKTCPSLFECSSGDFKNIIARGATYVLSKQTAVNGWSGYWYDNTHHDSWLACKFLREAIDLIDDVGLVSTIKATTGHLAAQRANWIPFIKSSQQAALIILMLKACDQPLNVAMADAILCAQLPSGLWDAEDYYKTLSPTGDRFFKSRLLTSALVARALACFSGLQDHDQLPNQARSTRQAKDDSTLLVKMAESLHVPGSAIDRSAEMAGR